MICKGGLVEKSKEEVIKKDGGEKNYNYVVDFSITSSVVRVVTR